MDKHLTLDDIIKISSDNLKEHKLEVPEWGGFIVIREMTAEARDQYELSLLQAGDDGAFSRNLENARAKMIAACAYGPDGKRMFKNEAAMKALGNMPISVIEPIFAKCQEINHLTDKDVEELAGN